MVINVLEDFKLDIKAGGELLGAVGPERCAMGICQSLEPGLDTKGGAPQSCNAIHFKQADCNSDLQCPWRAWNEALPHKTRCNIDIIARQQCLYSVIT
jgi:hypothetical protein